MPQSREHLINVAFETLIEEMQAWQTIPHPGYGRDRMVNIRRYPTISPVVLEQVEIPTHLESFQSYDVPEKKAKQFIQMEVLTKIVERIAEQCGTELT